MYPVYPSIAVNAAYTLHMLLSIAFPADSKSIVRRIPNGIRTAAVYLPLLVAVNIGILRGLGLVTAYSAPLDVLGALRNASPAQQNLTVCMGKEWYRFPSSYHLPNQMQAKFIKSVFNGLLPGEFAKDSEASGWLYGARAIPKGMNDRNIADPGKLVSVYIMSCLN